ncbi:MAG TPA: CARDB domain-containing protein [Chloroflexota bacterium]|nr:CARDB domain-containing protein [Chloroflexota bacterium]
MLPERGHGAIDGAYDLSEDAGYPVFTAQSYLLRLDLWEMDNGLSDHDFMGTVTMVLREEDGWGVGTYEVRGLFERGGKYFVTDYEAWIEIRRTPLPDLVPTAIRVVEGAGGIDRVCMSVVNNGWEPAGPFPLALTLDGTDHRVGIANMDGLAIGETREACVMPSSNLDLSGRHWLGATADEAGAMPELNEFNNHVELELNRTPPPTPTPTPSPALADLTVSAICVRGRVPDGKDDCKDGKNDVAVVVKNGGMASAGAFVVRLQIDGASGQPLDRTVPGLDADTEHEVRFDDVRLKKGEHKLEAVADAEKTVAERDEANNTRTVAAQCQDDD